MTAPYVRPSLRNHARLRPESPDRATPRRTLPVVGTAVRLIAVINDLAVPGSDVLVAQAEAIALLQALGCTSALRLLSGFDVNTVMREAQFPARSIGLRDRDGNAIRIGY